MSSSIKIIFSSLIIQKDMNQIDKKKETDTIGRLKTFCSQDNIAHNDNGRTFKC